MAKACGKCGKAYRKGGIAFVATPDGLKNKRVCQTCLGQAVVIIPMDGATRCSCGEVATKCSRCVDKRALRERKGHVDVAVLVKVLKNRARAYSVAVTDLAKTEYRDGVKDGLESAAELLESGRWSE